MKIVKKEPKTGRPYHRIQPFIPKLRRRRQGTCKVQQGCSKQGSPSSTNRRCTAMAWPRSGVAEPLIRPRALLRAMTCWSDMVMIPGWLSSDKARQVFHFAAVLRFSLSEDSRLFRRKNGRPSRSDQFNRRPVVWNLSRV